MILPDSFAVRKIGEKIVDTSKYGDTEGTFRLESLFKEEGYSKKNGRKNLDIDTIMEINEAVRFFANEPFYLTAEYNNTTGTYKTISFTKEQAALVLKIFNIYPIQEYRGVINSVLNVYKTSDISEVSKYAISDVDKIIREFQPYNNHISPDELLNMIQILLSGCEKIANLKEDTMIRNVSEKWFGGSKQIEKKYIRHIIGIFFPEEKFSSLSADKMSLMLNRIHLIRNPWNLPIKGVGTIHINNGTNINFTGYGNDIVSLSDNYIKGISSIESENCLIVENLTTFNDCPFPEYNGTVLYSEGFAKTPLINMIKKMDESGIKIMHCGDIDPAGFKIIKDEEKRSGVNIQPYHMDLQTYLKYKEMGISLTEKDRKDFTSMLLSEDYTEEQHLLFRKLLEDGNKLEQESLSA